MATGNLHLAVVLLSCVVLLIAIGLRYAARSGRSKSRVSAESLNEDLPIRVSLPFAFLHLAAAIAACCLGWIDAQHANWKQPIAVSYAVLLGLMQFGFKNERARAHLYRHVNAVTLAMFLLACVEDLLPLLIIGATSGLSVIRGGLIACLAAVLIVAAATPRPRRLLVSDTEAEETKTVEELSPEETCSLFSYYCSYEWLTYVILPWFRHR